MNQVQLNQGRKGEVGELNYRWLLSDGETTNGAEHPSPFDFCTEGVSCSGMIPEQQINPLLLNGGEGVKRAGFVFRCFSVSA